MNVRVRQNNIKSSVNDNSLEADIKALQVIVDGFENGFSSGFTTGYSSGNTDGFYSGFTEGYDTGFTAGYDVEHILNITLDFSSGETYTSFENIYSYGSWIITGSTNINTIFLNINNGGWIQTTGLTTDLGDDIQIYFSAVDSGLTSSIDFKVVRDPNFIETPVKSSNIKYLDAWMIQMLQSYQEINRNQLDPDEYELFFELLQPDLTFRLRGGTIYYTNHFRERYGHRTDAHWIKLFVFENDYCSKGNTMGYPVVGGVFANISYLYKNEQGIYEYNNTNSYLSQIFNNDDARYLEKGKKLIAFFHTPSALARLNVNLSEMGFYVSISATNSSVKTPVFGMYSINGNTSHRFPFLISGDTMICDFPIDNYCYFIYNIMPYDGKLYKKIRFTKNFHFISSFSMTIAVSNFTHIYFEDFRWIFNTGTILNFSNNRLGYEGLEHLISGIHERVKYGVRKIRWFTGFGTNNTISDIFFTDTTLEGRCNGLVTAPMIVSKSLELLGASAGTRTYDMTFDFQSTGGTYEILLMSQINGTPISNIVQLVNGSNTIQLISGNNPIAINHLLCIRPNSPSTQSNFKITNFNLITPIVKNNEIIANKQLDLRGNVVSASSYPDLVEKMNEVSSIYTSYGFTFTWLT